tara:strand:+ start:153 stop:374 length:222 start_codon:yes stop_codon:yes gene_type:complete
MLVLIFTLSKSNSCKQDESTEKYFLVSYGPKNKFSMASTFYFVNHDFRASTFLKMVETVYAAMALGGGWDEAI